MSSVLRRLGFRRAFFTNPVTLLAVALLALAWAQVVRADRNYDYTCSVTAPIHGGVINIPEYYVQPSDTLAYAACKGRVPDRWKAHWPLADCSPGGRARFSDGRLAFFPQKCRENTGNFWVY
ncbi:MAG: hypothetical protein FJX64_07240 [Alphaproteobacteria bacterium]|nr:hypothetical protein [Alphaproteobacteria bacterium]